MGMAAAEATVPAVQGRTTGGRLGRVILTTVRPIARVDR